MTKNKAIALHSKLKGFNRFAYLIKKPGKSLSKATAFLLLLTFSAQTVFAAAPLPQPILESAGISIPTDFGTVESIYTPQNPAAKMPLILHIQDAHAYPEAQQSIYQILRHLAKSKSISAVALEAAFGELKTDILNLSPVPQANRAVAERLAGMGELTGAELFALDASSRGIQIEGVEDLDLYKRSHEIFRSLKAKQEEIRSLFQSYGRVIEDAEIKKLNPELGGYLKARKLWESHSDNTLEYFSVLNTLSEKHLALKFSDMSKQFQWPNITRLISVKEAEHSLKVEEMQSEMEILNKALKVKITDSKTRSFLLEGLEHLTNSTNKNSAESWLAMQTYRPEVRTIRYFFEVLQRECRKAGISLLQFPQFLIYGRLQILQQEVDTNGLFKETALLEPQIEKKLIKTKAEQDLLQVRKDLSLLQNLFDLKLTRKDYEVYLKTRESLKPAIFSKRVKNITGEKQLPLFSEKMLRQAVEFYSLSRKRDEKLMEKTLAIAKNSDKATILITGGFHNEGISEMLRERHVPHMTVSPKMHSFVEQRFYEKIMGGEDSDPSYFLKTQNLGALFLLQPRQVYTDVFGNNPQFTERQRAAILGSWVTAGAEALQAQGWTLEQVRETLSKGIENHPEIFGNAEIGQESGKLLLVLEGQSSEFFSARSESRENLTPDVREYLDQILQNDSHSTSKLNRLILAMNQLERLKARELEGHGEEALYRTYAESLDLPSRPVTVIEQLTRNIYNSFNISEFPLAYRVAFVMQAFDGKYFPNLHSRIVSLMQQIDFLDMVMMNRLNPEEFWRVIKEFSRAEHQESIEANILLRVALDDFILHLEPEERRSLERQYIINELWQELRQAGTGNFPEIVFLTDMHGAATVFDFVAYSLGVKNYQNIQSILELEQRLAVENIDIDKKNIVFVGGSDYVDRGPKPYWGFLVNEWLRSHGKLRFIIGNHDLWKDWYILGMHLRVNDALRNIAASGKNDPLYVAEHLKTMRPFVAVLDETQNTNKQLRDILKFDDAKIKSLNDALNRLITDFLEKAAKGEADEEVIQKLADLIIDMDGNPNHALEFWSREWGIHGNWFDVFFDQINEEAINNAVSQINAAFSAADRARLETLLNSENIPKELVPYKETLLKNLQEDKVLFSSLALANHPQIKANKQDILAARKHNETIRRENETRTQRGEPPLPQKKVPSAFKISTEVAAEFLQSIVAQTTALNQSAGFSLPVPNVQLISETNARQNPMVMQTALWDMQHFRLLYVDIYGNAYLHGIIPIDRDQKNFKVSYTTQEGETLHGVAAIERIQYDVRSFFQDLNTIPDTPEFRQQLYEELGNAFAVLNEWYSDVLGFLKPQQIRSFIEQGGPSQFSDAYATSSSLSPRMFAGDKGVVHVGHVDPAKLYDAKIPYWVGGMAGGLAHGDFGASPGFLALGAVISWFHRSAEGLSGARRFGYRQTPEAIRMDLKGTEAFLKKEQTKDAKDQDPALIKAAQGTITRLTAHLGRIESGEEQHRIEDITFEKLPEDEVEKIREYTNGVNLAKYYVERFLRENIESFEGLVKKAEDRGDNRGIYYQEQLTYAQQRLDAFMAEKSTFRSEARSEEEKPRFSFPDFSKLTRELVIANHILVSFHSSFISSLFVLPIGLLVPVLGTIFSGSELAAGAFLWYVAAHTNIWWHERAHYWEAVRQTSLREDLLPEAESKLDKSDFRQLQIEFRAIFDYTRPEQKAARETVIQMRDQLFNTEQRFFQALRQSAADVEVKALQEEIKELNAKISEIERKSRLPFEYVGLNGWFKRWLGLAAWEARMFLLAPWGKFRGIQKIGLNYTPEGDYNLAVSAAGPRESGRLARWALSLSAVLFLYAFFGAPEFVHHIVLFFARLTLGAGAVALLDRFLADPGKLREFEEMKERLKRKSDEPGEAAATGEVRWIDQMAAVRKRMREERKTINLPDGRELIAPLGYRNSGMGGKHTEVQKAFRTATISSQEAMFIPLSAANEEEAQEITLALQSSLEDIITSTYGANVLGVGLEGGLVAKITPKKKDELPELTLWRLMKQAIEVTRVNGRNLVPGVDVALALDVAASEAQEAYREHSGKEDAVGQYLFWRASHEIIMSRDQLLALYKQAIADENLPIISIEDGFAEDDWTGWGNLYKEYGDKMFIVADDLSTTNDEIIQKIAKQGIANTLLVKPNQIGTLTEAVLAMVTSIGYGWDNISSHRSTKPNDLMESHVAYGLNTMGIKGGGGSNAERTALYKEIGRIWEWAAAQTAGTNAPSSASAPQSDAAEFVIESVQAFKTPTNAGTHTVGIGVTVRRPGFPEAIREEGAAPRGTSAGTNEAVDLSDNIIERSPMTDKYPDLFSFVERDQIYKFKKTVKQKDIDALKDSELSALWSLATDNKGKGMTNGVRYANEIIAPYFLGKKTVRNLGSLLDVDRDILNLEVSTHLARGKKMTDPIKVAQRKVNLGMNSTLAASLAFGRIIAKTQGKELWELLRDQAVSTMAKMIAENEGGNWEEIQKRPWLELVEGTKRATQQSEPEGMAFNPVFRRHLPIYNLNSNSVKPSRSESRDDGGRWISVSKAEETMHLPKDSLIANYPDEIFEVSLNYATHGVSSARVLGTVTFRKKENPSYQEDFVIKRSKSTVRDGETITEPSIARAAASLNLGPTVILSSRNILIEGKLPFGYDLASRGLLFSRQEAAIFGKKLADMFHGMVTNGSVLYYSSTPQTHLYVLGEEGEEGSPGFKMSFVSWANAFYGPKEVRNPANQYKALEMFAEMMRSYLAKPIHNIIAWKNFEARLSILQNATYDVAVEEGAPNYDELITNLKKQLILQDAGWGEFFTQAERVYTTGDVAIVEFGSVPIEDPDVFWRTDHLTRISLESAGKRTVELALRHNANLDSEVAKAIAEDLYQRGFIDIQDTPQAIQDKLQLFLKTNGFSSKNITEIMQNFLESMRLFPGWHISNILESLRSVLISLHYDGKQSGQFVEGFKSYLMSQQARRIHVHEESLPGLRNRFGGGSKIDLYFEGDEFPFKSYAVKGLHRRGLGEDERSQKASDLELGPHVIFTRPKPDRGTDQKPFVIVEDLLPEGRNILRVKTSELQRPREMNLLAGSLALKFYTMIDPKRGNDTVLHRFDNIGEHIFIVDNDILFIDWGFSLNLDSPGEGGAAKHLASLVDVLHRSFEKFGPEFWQKFEVRIMELAEQNGAMEEELRAAFARSETRVIPADERVLELVQGWVTLHSLPKTSDHETQDEAFLAPLTDAEGAAVAAKLLNFGLDAETARRLFDDFIHHLIVFPDMGEYWENLYMQLFLQNPELLIRGLLNGERVRIEAPIEMHEDSIRRNLRDAGYATNEYYLAEPRSIEILENRILTIAPKRQIQGKPVASAEVHPGSLRAANQIFTSQLSEQDFVPRSFRTFDVTMRSETRIEPQILAGYNNLSEFLGNNRPYIYTRWVAVHITNGIFLPLPADIWEKAEPFITADLLQPVGQPRLSDAKALQFGLDLSVFDSMPKEEDLLYGIAKVLNEEPNRYVRVAILNADDTEIQRVNTWFTDEFRAYPNLQGRFQASSLPAQGRALESGVQKILDEVRLRAKEQGSPVPGSMTEFYRSVSLSSTNTQLLRDLMVPAAWRIANDLPSDSAALQAYLIERKLALTQGLLAAEKIKQLTEVKDQVISAVQQFLAGEDLSRIESAFENTIMALREIYRSA